MICDNDEENPTQQGAGCKLASWEVSCQWNHKCPSPLTSWACQGQCQHKKTGKTLQMMIMLRIMMMIMLMMLMMLRRWRILLSNTLSFHCVPHAPDVNYSIPEQIFWLSNIKSNIYMSCLAISSTVSFSESLTKYQIMNCKNVQFNLLCLIAKISKIVFHYQACQPSKTKIEINFWPVNSSPFSPPPFSPFQITSWHIRDLL